MSPSIPMCALFDSRQPLKADRSRARVEDAFKSHLAALETLQMNVGAKEEAIVAQERVVSQEELAAVLARI